MKFFELKLGGAYWIELEPCGDERGWFTRLFCANELREIGFTKQIVNINHSYTQQKGTIRGLHFQYPPDCEIKIAKCLHGAVWDCVVDIRRGSPTFLQWEAVELTSQNNRMIYIPEGFAHGFQTLTNDVEIVYFVTNFYAPQNEDGLRYNDPVLSIDFPLEATIISDKDRQHPLIADHFEGITIQR
jgi:dTDP-4-dehydrorhamnose 3,5-epimerase